MIDRACLRQGGLGGVVRVRELRGIDVAPLWPKVPTSPHGDKIATAPCPCAGDHHTVDVSEQIFLTSLNPSNEPS